MYNFVQLFKKLLLPHLYFILNEMSPKKNINSNIGTNNIPMITLKTLNTHSTFLIFLSEYQLFPNATNHYFF